MEVYCTRPSCPRPLNHFADLDTPATLRTIPQKYCTACGLELLLAGRYFPVKVLGQGGFGTAYLARDRYTPAMRFCVVKQFQPSNHLTAQQLQLAQNLFEREGQVLEELGTNPQIPDLLAFFALPVTRRFPDDPDQFFYLVQEFIDGQNLEQELEQQGRFSEAKILELLQSLLPVLQFVHDRGSIHRDIKPSNVMRRKDGTLFLLDFGAVKQATSATPGQAQPSSTGIYSMGFAPPEQMKGNQVYPATDLYALAVTCLMLLTREQPQDLYDTYRDEWNWRSYVTVSDRLATVLDRLLLPTPSQRFQSASEVLAALHPSSSPGSVPAVTPTAAPVRPAPGQVAKSGSIGTAIQTPPAASPVPVSTPAPAPTPTPKPAPKSKPTRKPFSTLEYLYNAAFTGFEGGLVTIALASLLGTIAFTPTFWLILMAIGAGLVIAQALRWIERIDLLLIAGGSIAAIFFLPFLRDVLPRAPFLRTLLATTGSPLQTILIAAGVTALTVVFVAIVFRLVYKLVARLL
ncbi:serine/threonine-protein kinase [Leptolyngbya sp. FACHB-711]|uniref:serine/threonine-protein kinase n=1 Tax=unclassified Leptolyngbya TaxID=2650499 RepID=UPI0016883488|nr:serine/threonine-protein kinase [Leptolyngbya sp. FACHB-711]MBD1851168.1 serine/threonine protein kinase [Cyanobacteria bacterium FACHB-502]MBD2023056.1 serine/threonine protein kinase [Leptolyngbya sp. FACHB-711]